MKVMSVAEVAELLGRDDPETRAAAAFVGRLVRDKGLPCLDLRPRRFVRHHVEAWIESRATTPTRPTSSTPNPRPKSSARGSLDDAILKLERELAG